MQNNMVWIDLEFSGLDVGQNVILEIATLITNPELEIIAEGPNLAIHHHEEILEAMDDWNKTHHQTSGLIDLIRASQETHQSAEAKTLEFIAAYCQKGQSPLCGNSVHQDRQFLQKYMPRITDFLHYRIIDVSTVKELALRWYPTLPAYEKKESHVALEDIRESVAELRYLRSRIFVSAI